MSSKAMSLKGRIKNYAKSNNIAAQVVLQNYMFECFLARLSISEYSENNATEKLEERLGDILIALYEKAEENRIDRERREEEQRKREEEACRREEHKKKKRIRNTENKRISQ